MTSVRQAFKRKAERALTTDGLKRIFAHRRRGKILILAYHGIIPDGEQPVGDAALFVSRSDFAAQLDELAKETVVVPLSQIDMQPDEKPLVAITFDDAYHGAVHYGVPELVQRKMPATIFVAPGRLNRHVFWWDALAAARGTLDAGVRGRALQEFAGMDEAIRVWTAAEIGTAAENIPDFARSSTDAELAAALRNPEITVGSHTWSHPNLARLPAREIETELSRSREWLTRRFGPAALPWLAYPYGLSSPIVRRIARQQYVGALAIGGGWHRSADVSPFARPRLSVSAGLSLNGFRARLTGVLR
jgi:peptidoglycan/xylan/chitin deacetylase (PgdA/CDA1 family)